MSLLSWLNTEYAVRGFWTTYRAQLFQGLSSELANQVRGGKPQTNLVKFDVPDIEIE
jgi:hypothetical protein